MTDSPNTRLHQQYPYPDEETRKNCLDKLRESNRQLELYNLFLDDAISQIDLELRQHKRERLLQRVQSNQ
ncbi:hypothetical protein [Chamaesiphon sp. VAR_48_metabat_403]|uniref:hypothetical protein n=1 Tax=Chamaesiphon sp. VAR_48_metabat_403 TaxID=2964700 RepID=UPI00286E2D6B|nr:hypothetical protein [Chamaesiphon sp. VAR_48_metabat_403]